MVRPTTVWLLLAVTACLWFGAYAGTNCSAADSTKNCVDGMFIPIWRPFLDLSVGDRFGRGLIYFVVIAYCFLGVSIVADRFMSSIEVITSQERTVTIKRPGLEPIKVTVRIWNETVSNLTLMALGSSAPEILLSIIEVIGKNFQAGDLGPNTIVGSAAFNLFMIITICVASVPSNEHRKQKHLDVFFVTATWSVFAYIWMYVILAVISPGVIEVWEGLLTFIFFPLTVLTAWIADIKIIQTRFVPHKYRKTSHGMIATEDGDVEMKAISDGSQAYKLIPQHTQHQPCEEQELTDTEDACTSSNHRMSINRPSYIISTTSSYDDLSCNPHECDLVSANLTKVQERFMKRMDRKRAASFGGEELIPTTQPIGKSYHDSPMGSTTVNSISVPAQVRKRMGSWIGGLMKRTGEESDESLKGLTEDQLEIAQLGKPRLGEHTRCQITIRESKEFQNVVDRMLKTANMSIMLGTSTWREQFKEALTVSGGDDDDDDEEGEEGGDGGGSDKEPYQPTWGDYVLHFICVPWKLLFALIPPTDYIGGWACFVVSILGIGFLTALIGDLASQFGCWVGLKDAVTAITFVALGTSVPDTFASKVAAMQDKYADSSIGNVTGSNGVNVFLGIGIAWTMAAVYHWWHGNQFIVDPGTLAFSVTIFCIEALLCIFVIVLRRHPAVGGELGGPLKFKIPTCIFFTSLWLFYIIASALESYCIIEGF
uniref:Sodium/calcium exchanger membrane region domain-containing protein n=1 Tax=Plectus sambesii TaxID=2011161 RepID=A0A914V5A8_9BILA